MLKQSLAALLAATILMTGSLAWSQDDTEQPEQTWTVNFKDTDIEEVIKFVADVTGRTIVMDPRVKGRVKVISQKPVNKRELYNLFRDILEVHDFAVVEVGEVSRIIPLKDARSAPIPVGDPDDRGYVTEVYQLKNVDASKVLPVLRPLIPQHSHMAADTYSNSIVISDTAPNIERIMKVIEKIDQSAISETEVIQLKYADAEDMVATLTKLSQNEAKQQPTSNQLQMIADKRNNSILLRGEDVQRRRAKELIYRLDRPQVQSGNVRVVYLNYAKAKDVAAVLTKVVQNMQKAVPGGGEAKPGGEGGVTVEADEDTNALLITGSGDTLNSLMAVIEKLDVRRAQVLIEAIIVTVNVDKNSALGIDYFGLDSEKGLIGGSVNSTTGQSTLGRLGEAALAGDETAMGGAILANQGLSLGFLGVLEDSDKKFGALLNAIQRDNNANLLSTPSLLTMDNNEASISVGQEISIATGSFSTVQGGGGISSPFTTSSREEVGILLTVTPQVNEGNKVLLTVAQEVSSLSGTDANGQPITDKSEINTQILANDGQIIVLGGLIEDNVTKDVTKVPLLGSIPVLGNLFKTTKVINRRDNLMVFLRAKIIRDDDTMYGATAEKYRFMRDQQIYQREQGLGIMGNDEALPILPDITVEELYKDKPADKKAGAK